MGPADDVEASAKASPLYAKYGTRKESESARELLAARMQAQAQPSAAPPPKEEPRKAARAARDGGGVLGDFLKSSGGRTLEREIVRGVFGLLKKQLR
jgi:hypothetical protein